MHGVSLRVFLSYTSELAEYPRGRSFVSAARAAVTRVGHVVSDMTYFTSRDQSPSGYCRQQVERADVYVGLIGFRYGSPVRDQPTLSYTELEYETATTRRLPRLMFLLDENAEIPLPVSQILDRDHGHRQHEFRTRIMQAPVTVAIVVSPAELETRLYQSLMELGSATSPFGGVRTVVQPVDSMQVRIPNDIPEFTGRAAELQELRALTLAQAGGVGKTVVVSGVAGMGGVGKSALVLHLANQLKRDFPEIELYINMHGYDDEQRLTPQHVLDTFLRALGVSEQALPPTLEAQRSLYNERLSRLRGIVVLDNASSEADVLPLIPATLTESVVLVTSRDSLEGLVASRSAVVLHLGEMTDDDAIQLLLTIAKRASGVGREDGSARALVQLCGNLPLAICIVGAKLASRPTLSIADLVATLRDERSRIALLRAGSVSVEACFEVSYRDLEPDAAAAFRRLGLIAASEFSVECASAAVDVPFSNATMVLEELLAANLLQYGNRPSTFRFHDLLRLYARSKARTEEHDVLQTIGRILDWYLAAVDIAADAIMGCQRLDRARPPTRLPPDISERTSAIAWLEAEREGILAGVRQGSESNNLPQTWHLADAMWGFYYLRKHWPDWIESQQIGLRASRLAHAPDSHAEAWLLCNLGVAYWDAHRPDEAEEAWRRAAELARRGGARKCEARAVNGMALAHRARGEFSAALGYAQQALPIRREVGDRWGEAVSLDNIAYVHASLGNRREAIATFADALKVWREISDPWGEALSLNDWGRAYNGFAQYEQAVESLRESLAIRRRVGDLWGEAESLRHMGESLLHMGEGDSAFDCWHRARELFSALKADDEVREVDDLVATAGLSRRSLDEPGPDPPQP
jgi:tetratricopeptide (TPR) repeat protein